MSAMKIKNLFLRRLRQRVTRGLTNFERQSWGSNGQQVSQRGRPKGYNSRGGKVS